MPDQSKGSPNHFSLERIYTKDVSYEAPNAPAVFLEKIAPQLDIQLGIHHSAVDPAQSVYEVVLRITAQAQAEEKNVFLVEIQQAGLFRIPEVNGEALVKVLEISCPYVLLPFARETINSLVSKGSFPPLLINPINFEALYEQKQAALTKPATH